MNDWGKSCAFYFGHHIVTGIHPMMDVPEIKCKSEVFFSSLEMCGCGFWDASVTKAIWLVFRCIHEEGSIKYHLRLCIYIGYRITPFINRALDSFNILHLTEIRMSMD